MAFFRKCIEARTKKPENSDELVPTEKIDEPEDLDQTCSKNTQPYWNSAFEEGGDRLTPTTTQRKKQGKATASARKARKGEDRVAPLSEVCSSVEDMEAFAVIFSLKPGARSIPLDSGRISEVTGIIEALCKSLNRCGVVAVVEKNELYCLKIQSLPACCEEFYFRHKKVLNLCTMHKEKAYLDHADKMISYLFHFVCLLARDGNEEAKDILLKYRDHLNWDRIKELYPDVADALLATM
ncbi:MAG: hypothetical protein ACSW8C_03055 [bacterium]